MSIERLLHDKLFASNCKGMTGLPDHTALVMFFNICLGFAGGVLPLQYSTSDSENDAMEIRRRRDRARPTRKPIAS